MGKADKNFKNTQKIQKDTYNSFRKKDVAEKKIIAAKYIGIS